MELGNLFLTNSTSTSFLQKLQDGLRKCTSFSFSVSFIKSAGLSLFKREIEEALDRGVKGKIITSSYQNFTDTTSLNIFLEWSKKYTNFECHFDYACFGDNGFHSKGYLFEYEDSYEFIVGSTNITFFALQKNIEWNVSLYSKDKFSSINDAYNEFDSLWNKTLPLDEQLIEEYKMHLAFAIERWDMDDFYTSENKILLQPNQMQKKALKELRRYRDTGVSKALIIAATGSGKTYLAAFDARNFDAKRLLYIVHEQNILTAAKNSFEAVFGAERSYGFYTGTSQDLECDFIFASTQMLLKHLNSFSPNEFDYIIYDEVHHMASDGGMKIFQYFTPSFLLGLTATPERMDNKDVIGLFDENVPFELRLKDAINNDLVVPFHYYAIRDEFADYSSDDQSKVAREISKTINVEFIVSQIKKYKKQGEKLKCLAFCTSIAHCQTMADEFNARGYNAKGLIGKNSPLERATAFTMLQDENKPLEIICAVDILNEGVDIPSVNMVLFLRPTESSTVFLQQLGRGLRKYPNKDYVTVLDFIGNNYGRSIQIALALGTLGNASSSSKAYLKQLVNTNFQSINVKDVQIFFDDLSRSEIIHHLDTENFNKIRYLKKDYQNFKKYINCPTYPSHQDYIQADFAPDLNRFIRSSRERSYYGFLKSIGEENLPSFNDDEENFIVRVSTLIPAVRLDEIYILKQYINEGSIDEDKLQQKNNRITNKTIKNAYLFLKYKKIFDDSNKPTLSIFSPELLEYLNDLLDYGIQRYEMEFGEYTGEFKSYANYYKEQVEAMLLKEHFPFMQGTQFLINENKAIFFVGLKKDENSKDAAAYKDKFISPKIFQWESVVNTTFDKGDGPKLLKNPKVYLFIRRSESEDGITSPFTFIGTGKLTNPRTSSSIASSGSAAPTLLFDVELDEEVDKEYWFDYEIPVVEEN